MTPLLWVQAIIEVVGGVALLVGKPLPVRSRSFSAATWRTACFLARAPRSVYPVVNGGDAAILFCFIFFYIIFAGGGPLSFDRIARQNG